MSRLRLSLLLEHATDQYLQKCRPRLNDQYVVHMKELTIRDYLLEELSSRGFRAEKEVLYQNTKKRCDIVVRLKGRDVYIEMKQSAQWTDGIQKRDLVDFGKFKELAASLKPSDVRAVCVLNINPKFDEFPEQWTHFDSALSLPCRNIGLKALTRFWNETAGVLGTDNFRLAIRRYDHPRPLPMRLIREYGRSVQLNAMTLCFASEKRFL